MWRPFPCVGRVGRDENERRGKHQWSLSSVTDEGLFRPTDGSVTMFTDGNLPNDAVFICTMIRALQCHPACKTA